MNSISGIYAYVLRRCSLCLHLIDDDEEPHFGHVTDCDRIGSCSCDEWWHVECCPECQQKENL